MGDFLWDLFETVWKSDQVRMLMWVGVLIAIGFLGRQMFNLKDKLEKHEAQDALNFVEIKNDIENMRDNHLAHLAADVKKLDQKVDKIMFHLIGPSDSSSDDTSS